MLQPSRELMDDDSYKLAMELMIEDARQIGSGDDGKGKGREGSVSDNELAFRLYTQDLESAFTIDADRRLSASMQHAVRTDSNAFLRFQHEERMAQYDHEVAVALSDNRAPPPMPPPAPPLEPVPELEMEPASNNDNDDDDDDNGHVSPEGKGPKDGKQSEKGKGKGKESVAGGIDRTNSLKRARSEGLASPDEADDDLIFQGKRSKQGESSAWAASRQPEPNRRPCTSCMEAIPESQLIRAPCSHDYCHACVKGLFTSAMRDESLFPPKCCRQAIPAGEHVDILGADLINLYHAKRIEFSTENRTYCHNAECGAFINPAEVGRCSKCDRQTCVSCKKAAHIGDCPQDMELQRVLELAEQRNWRRCASCSSMVELAHGCNHMTFVSHDGHLPLEFANTCFCTVVDAVPSSAIFVVSSGPSRRRVLVRCSPKRI